MTVAAFMDLALYDPEFGYYARMHQRSGRAGDFFTSVDVGPLFGELLAVQLGEMAHLLRSAGAPDSPVHHQIQSESHAGFDLVEAGAGNGRLSADILHAAREHDPAFYQSINLHLVESSATARARQGDTLAGTLNRGSGSAAERESRAMDRNAGSMEREGIRRAMDVADRLRSSTATLPDTFEGALIANELLDAMPVHQVVMREDGLREVFVDAGRPRPAHDSAHAPQGFALTLVEGSPSTPALEDYLERVNAHLEPGWRAEINLRGLEWIRDAAKRLRRGFMILIDYGHEARELYSVSHSAGTLTTFSRHHSSGPEAAGAAPWLANPGEQDITAHVDFTSVKAAAEAAGMTTVALLDQTYFLLGLVPDHRAFERPAALKTLIMPGGLGSTLKVLILGKNVGAPALKGCSFKVRMT